MMGILLLAGEHVFWDCPIINDYWKEINDALQNIFKQNIPLESKLMYFGNVPQDISKGNKYFMTFLLTASKKKH